jgi:hypothetical protein
MEYQRIPPRGRGTIGELKREREREKRDLRQ